MFWYIVICILMLYPLGMVIIGNRSGRKTQHLALLFSCILLWIFMAMRSSSVGVDTKNYEYVFKQLSEAPLHKIFTIETFATYSKTWKLDFEYGYRLYNKFISFFTHNPHVITVCNSSVIIILLYNLIKKNSMNCLLSVWLYITLGIYQTEMNVTRNAIAILIVYNAFCFLKQNRWLAYTLCCLIGASFHKAVLVFIPLYWIIKKVRWNKKRIIIFSLFMIILSIIFPLVTPILKNILPLGLTRYLVSNNSKMEAALVGIFHLVLVLFIYFFMNRPEREKFYTKNNISLTMFILNLSCFCISSGIGYGARMAALFGPYMILYIPELLSMIESKKKKRRLIWGIVILCGCQYFLRLSINNIGGTMPYTFWG